MTIQRLLKCIYPATALFLVAVAMHAAAQENTPATPIQHVIVIYQENVSFDHYFATYPIATNPPGEPRFIARRNTPSVNGLTGALLTNNPNAFNPFRLDRTQAVTCDQGHSYSQEQLAVNHGIMNHFVESTGVATASCDDGIGKKLVMGYYDGNTVTALWNYAQNFSLSDNFFGTVFGPSAPGALSLAAGTNNGAAVVRDTGTGSVDVVAGTVINDPRPAFDDCVPGSNTTIAMSGKNVGDLLNAKGITWGWFQGGFTPTSRHTNGSAVCASFHANVIGTKTFDYVPHHNPFQFFSQTANPHHLPPTSVDMIGKTDQANHIYDLSDFWSALAAGNLPAVSFLKAPSFQDGHAQSSDPLDEQVFLVNALNQIQQTKQWKSTAVIVAYDDSDGWYDHLMPPIMSQSNLPIDQLSGPGACGASAPGSVQGRCGYGPRLPLLVISPWAKENFVDHVTVDQTSILRFIEDNWGLGRVGSDTSDVFAGSLENMFEFGKRRDRDGDSDDNDRPARRLILDPTTGQRLRDRD
jgi:phospholipase C